MGKITQVCSNRGTISSIGGNPVILSARTKALLGSSQWKDCEPCYSLLLTLKCFFEMSTTQCWREGGIGEASHALPAHCYSTLVHPPKNWTEQLNTHGWAKCRRKLNNIICHYPGPSQAQKVAPWWPASPWASNAGNSSGDVLMQGLQYFGGNIKPTSSGFFGDERSPEIFPKRL